LERRKDCHGEKDRDINTIWRGYMKKRLYLFLQFPDLRWAFQEIELRDLGEHNKGKHSRLLSLLSRIIEIKIEPRDLRWSFQEIELKDLAAQRALISPTR
jgi:hypothetical protein